MTAEEYVRQHDMYYGRGIEYDPVSRRVITLRDRFRARCRAAQAETLLRFNDPLFFDVGYIYSPYIPNKEILSG